MNTEKYFDSIEKYFEGQMSTTEEAAFEAEMERNPALKTTVENYEIANDAVELLIENKLREELSVLRKAKQPENVISINRPKKTEAKTFKMSGLIQKLAIAASIALVVGFFTFQLMGNQYTNDRLMSANYGEINFSTIRGGDEQNTNVVNSASIVTNATNAWEEGNYDRAIALTTTIAPTDDYFAKAQYILGHSFYKKGAFKKAQTAFETTATQQNEKYTEKAQWYAILAAIGSKDSDVIIQSKLDVIINDKGHGFEQQAKNLKADLNSFWR